MKLTGMVLTPLETGLPMKYRARAIAEIMAKTAETEDQVFVIKILMAVYEGKLKPPCGPCQKKHK